MLAWHTQCTTHKQAELDTSTAKHRFITALRTAQRVLARRVTQRRRDLLSGWHVNLQLARVHKISQRCRDMTDAAWRYKNKILSCRRLRLFRGQLWRADVCQLLSSWRVANTRAQIIRSFQRELGVISEDMERAKGAYEQRHGDSKPTPPNKYFLNIQSKETKLLSLRGRCAAVPPSSSWPYRSQHCVSTSSTAALLPAVAAVAQINVAVKYFDSRTAKVSPEGASLPCVAQYTAATQEVTCVSYIWYIRTEWLHSERLKL